MWFDLSYFLRVVFLGTVALVVLFLVVAGYLFLAAWGALVGEVG